MPAPRQSRERLEYRASDSCLDPDAVSQLSASSEAQIFVIEPVEPGGPEVLGLEDAQVSARDRIVRFETKLDSELPVFRISNGLKMEVSPSVVAYIFQFDLKTKLPIRFKMWSNSDFKGKPYITVNKIEYNPVLQEGIFDFTIPEGVEVMKH